jgi:hypothetical protein
LKIGFYALILPFFIWDIGIIYDLIRIPYGERILSYGNRLRLISQSNRTIWQRIVAQEQSILIVSLPFGQITAEIVYPARDILAELIVKMGNHGLPGFSRIPPLADKFFRRRFLRQLLPGQRIAGAGRTSNAD